MEDAVRRKKARCYARVELTLTVYVLRLRARTYSLSLYCSPVYRGRPSAPFFGTCRHISRSNKRGGQHRRFFFLCSCSPPSFSGACLTFFSRERFNGPFPGSTVRFNPVYPWHSRSPRLSIVRGEISYRVTAPISNPTPDHKKIMLPTFPGITLYLVLGRIRCPPMNSFDCNCVQI